MVAQPTACTWDQFRWHAPPRTRVTGAAVGITAPISARSSVNVFTRAFSCHTPLGLNSQGDAVQHALATQARNEALDYDQAYALASSVQFGQTPWASMTVYSILNPASRATGPRLGSGVASATASHLRHIRNAGACASPGQAQAMKALRRSIRCANPCLTRKSNARYATGGCDAAPSARSTSSPNRSRAW